jgi:hypothetical protein
LSTLSFPQKPFGTAAYLSNDSAAYFRQTIVIIQRIEMSHASVRENLIEGEFNSILGRPA